MLRYSYIKKNKYKIKKLIGLSKKQFEELEKRLHSAWVTEKENLSKKINRKRRPGGGRHEKIFYIEDKLLFILMFYRYNLTHFMLGTLFGIDASNATRLIHKLTPLIEKISDPRLKNCLKGMKRNTSKIGNFKDFCQLYPRVKLIVLDAFEQPAKRPISSNSERKKYYSGKKKMFSHKIQLVVSQDRRILNVSRNYPGSVHDKTILLEEKSIQNIPECVPILFDKGYQGIKDNYQKHVLLIPFKKARNKDQPKWKKKFNRELNVDRVVVEHTIGDVKKYRVLSDKYRGTVSRYNQIVRSIAAIHNFKLDYNI